MMAAEEIREDHMVAHFMRPLSLAGIDTTGEPELVLPDERERFGTRANALSGGRGEIGGDPIALQLCPKWLEGAWRPDEVRRLCQLATARFGSHRVVVRYQPEHEPILRQLQAVPAEMGIAGCAGDLLEWLDTSDHSHPKPSSPVSGNVAASAARTPTTAAIEITSARERFPIAS
jgi:hypothetical protein